MNMLGKCLPLRHMTSFKQVILSQVQWHADKLPKEESVLGNSSGEPSRISHVGFWVAPPWCLKAQSPLTGF